MLQRRFWSTDNWMGPRLSLCHRCDVNCRYFIWGGWERVMRPIQNQLVQWVILKMILSVFFSTFFWSWWQRRCVWNGRIFRADVNCHSYQRCLPVFNDAFKINRQTLRRMTTKNVIIAMVMKWKVWYCGNGTALDCRRAFSCFLFSKDSPRPRHHIPIPRVDVRLCRKKENHHQHLHRMPSRSQ